MEYSPSSGRNVSVPCGAAADGAVVTIVPTFSALFQVHHEAKRLGSSAAQQTQRRQNCITADVLLDICRLTPNSAPPKFPEGHCTIGQGHHQRFGSRAKRPGASSRVGSQTDEGTETGGYSS